MAGEFLRGAGSRLSSRMRDSLPRSLARREQPQPQSTNVGNTDAVKEEAIPLLDQHLKKCCVLVVGQTGSGKSATASRLVSCSSPPLFESGSGSERVTRECQAERMLGEDVWVVDTVGWQDADADDEELFQDILRFIRREHFTHVSAVLWCVIPNVRRDAALSRHAALIHSLGNEVWPNVVVVCKQSMRPERDGGGATAAAREAAKGACNPKVIGYRFLADMDDDQQLAKLRSDADSRRAFNVLTDEEVHETLSKTLTSLPDAVRVDLDARKRCLDCGAEEDPRLMPLHCHMESRWEHLNQTAVKMHPGEEELFHPLDVDRRHTGKLRRLWYGKLVCRKGRRYTCCGRRAGMLGCTATWQCCQRLVATRFTNDDRDRGCARRHSCCQANVKEGSRGCRRLHPCCKAGEGGRGCVERCVRCGREWGTAAEKCYRRPHNLVDVETEQEEEETETQENKSKKNETLFNMDPFLTLKFY